MKNYRIIFIFFITIATSTACNINNFQKAKNQQRWSQLIFTQAQIEDNPHKQIQLFDRAKKQLHDSTSLFKKNNEELLYNAHLLKKIAQNESYFKELSEKPCIYYAKKALLRTIIAKEQFKASKQLIESLQQKKSPLENSSFKKLFCRKNNQKISIEEMRQQVIDLLNAAQKNYYKAAEFYMVAYTNSKDEYCLHRIEKILSKNIYAIECTQLAQSAVFTIPNEKGELLERIRSEELLREV